MKFTSENTVEGRDGRAIESPDNAGNGQQSQVLDDTYQRVS